MRKFIFLLIFGTIIAIASAYLGINMGLLLPLIGIVAGIIAGIAYLLRKKRIRQWWPVVVIAGIVLVTRFLPYVEFLSDIVVLLLLLVGVVACVLRLSKIKWVKWMLTVVIAAVVLISMFPPVTFLIFESMPELLDRLFPLGGKSEIIELNKFRTFYGKKDDRYYFTVLMKSPPKDMDKLKARMVQYFYEKTQYINAVDSGSYVGSVHFWKYARRTAYFINHDEDHGGFSTDYLEKYPDTRIGYISREPCKDDPAKYEDMMYMYDDEYTLIHCPIISK
jgi:hypothetical protein